MNRCVFIAGMLLVVLAGCSGPAALQSGWTESPVVVDGDAADWRELPLVTLDSDVQVGVRNDATSLYLVLISGRSDVIRSRFRGPLTVWFDHAGGEEKRFGIRFASMPPMPADGRAQEMPMRERMRAEGAPDDMPGGAHTATVTFLYDGADEGATMSTVEARGVEVRLERAQDLLVYELRVPLRHSTVHPFGIDVGEGPLGIGIETGSFMRRRGSQDDGEGMQRGGRGGYPGGGGHPGGGRPGGGMGPGGGMRGGDGEQPTPYKEWFVVTLARR